MTLDSRLLRSAGVLALVLLGGACGKKADSNRTDSVPEVSAAGVPDVPASNASDGSATRFERELSRYQLTMDKVRKWAPAAETMKRVERDHPELKEGTGGLSDESVAEATSRIERIPEARKALQDAGLNAREYMLIGISIVTASAAQVAIQQGVNADTLAREVHIHPANLRFVKEHEAELAKFKHLLQ